MNTFHRVYEMFAWNTGKDVFLFLEDDFRDLILSAIRDENEMLRYMFSLKAGLGGQKSFKRKTRQIERNLKRAKLDYPREYSFAEEESKIYIRDYLEVYKFSVKRMIWDEFEPSKIAVKVYSKPHSIINQIFRSMPPQIAGFDISLIDILSLRGTPTEFVLGTRNGNFTFSPHGVTW